MSILSLGDFLAVFIAGIMAGIINAFAGGGTFIAFPVLMLTGISPLVANATCSVGIWPGVVATSIGYKDQLASYKKYLPALGIIGTIGGALGGFILLHTSNDVFKDMVPWLLLGATLLFAFGNKVKSLAGMSAQSMKNKRYYFIIGLVMIVISVYGGFFGAGVGILLLAMFQMMQLGNIHEMNALKALLSIAIHGSAVIALLFGDIIDWSAAITLMAGAVIGGYFAARIALNLPHSTVRAFVLVTAIFATIYSFVKYI